MSSCTAGWIEMIESSIGISGRVNGTIWDVIVQFIFWISSISARKSEFSNTNNSLTKSNSFGTMILKTFRWKESASLWYEKKNTNDESLILRASWRQFLKIRRTFGNYSLSTREIEDLVNHVFLKFFTAASKIKLLVSILWICLDDLPRQ